MCNALILFQPRIINFRFIQIFQKSRKADDQGKNVDESFLDDDDDLEGELLADSLQDFVIDPTGELYFTWQVLLLFSTLKIS